MDLGLCTYIQLVNLFFFSSSLIKFLVYRPASSKTASQPKSIAVTGDSTVFISEIDTVEAFRFNQKVFEQKPKYQPGAIAAHGSVVAVGEVCMFSFFFLNIFYVNRFFFVFFF